MFLKSLLINNGSEIVREISFRKGLNLIIDDTKTNNRQESGNNVGKTTVLKLIDFCLGGDGINIYKDPEFKDKANNQIETFLKESGIVITLTLKKELNILDSEEINIRKNFLKNKQKIQEINGQYYNDNDFDKKLKSLIFNSDSPKPTFRQIISKNIRYEKKRLDNTIKVLHFGVTFEVYESLYFFWFGIPADTAGRKQQLHSAQTTEEIIIRRLKRDGSLAQISQSLLVIERDIEELNKKKASFNLNENYESDLQQLNNATSKINSLSTRIIQVNLRKEIIEESRAELEKEFANIDISQLENIYKTAESFVQPLHTRFSELVSFHNQMLIEKIKFITNELPSIENDLQNLKENLNEQIAIEKEIATRLAKLGAIEELEVIVGKLNAKFEQKGRYEEQQAQWIKSNEKIREIEQELKDINEGIATLESLFATRIGSFNKFFSKISEKLYGEQFILSPDTNERGYELKISTIGGNPGTGKKKGEIVAFDIAYIQFCDDNDIPCLHFILHDQIENVHDNQLMLIKDIVEPLNIQYIAPILKDKLPVEIDSKTYSVLSLSQNNKLFKVS